MLCASNCIWILGRQLQFRLTVSSVPGCYYGASGDIRVAFSRGGSIAFMLTAACYQVGGINVGLLTYALAPSP